MTSMGVGQEFSPAPEHHPLRNGLLRFLLLAGWLHLGTGIAAAGINTWTSNGPPGHDVIRVLAIDPAAPDTLYAALHDGGLFKSIDAGETWSATGLSTALAALAIDPDTPTTLYAGSLYQGGVYKSTDGGETWQHTGLGEGEVRALAVDATTPGILYAVAGTDGGYGFKGGVFRSTDGASTWTEVLPDASFPSPFPAVPELSSVAIDPLTPTTLYAATDGGLVFKSTDSGQSWSWMPVLHGAGGFPGSALAIDSVTPTTVYFGTEGGLVKSTDGGETWEQILTDPVYALVIDPMVPSTIYAGGLTAVFKSTNSGETWGTVLDRHFYYDHPVFSALAIGPASVHASTFKSTDGGSSWTDSYTGLPGLGVRDLVVDPDTAGTLYVATESGDEQVFKSADGGKTWTAAHIGLPAIADCRDLVIVPSSPRTLYAGFSGYNGVYKSDDDATWRATGLIDTDVYALAADPTDIRTVYAAGQAGSIQAGASGVFRTIDGGNTWDFVGAPPGAPPQALAVDPSAPSTLYAGLDEGGVFKSIDGGASWTEINEGIGSIPSKPTIDNFIIDPSEPTTVYALSDGGGAYKSVDGGAEWTALAKVPANVATGMESVHALALDPSRSGTLYGLGTYNLFQSTDGGSSWEVVGSYLPPQGGGPIAVDPHIPGRLYSGGRSVFSIDLVGGCVGDCNGDDEVSVDELILLVGIALGDTSSDACGAGDRNEDDLITIDELITAVVGALRGCTVAPPYELCVTTGGTVIEGRCCIGAGDFPDTCGIGACGCGPDNSETLLLCECIEVPGVGCFDRRLGCER